MAFSTVATTADGVLGDLWTYAVQRERDAGRVNSSDAITQAAGNPPKDAEGFVAGLMNLYGSRSQTFGGGAMDPLEYARKRRDFISTSEGVSYGAYDGTTGHTVAQVGRDGVSGPTAVGIGFNMDRRDARDVWQQAGVQADFDQVYNGKAALAQADVERLFDHTALEAEQVVQSRTKGVSLTDNQRLALVSMAFHGPTLIGPKIIGALRDGDQTAVLNEILNNSNGGNVKGIANRRFREAAQFAGSEAQSRLPAYNSYISRYA